MLINYFKTLLFDGSFNYKLENCGVLKNFINLHVFFLFLVKIYRTSMHENWCLMKEVCKINSNWHSIVSAYAFGGQA